MSRAGTLLSVGDEKKLSPLPKLDSSSTMWTEPISLSETRENVYQEVEDFSIYGRSALLDKQTKAMTASLQKIAQQLSQATIVPIHLMSLALFSSRLPQEQDLWIEMRPHSVKKVIVNVKYTGRGEFPNIDDELVEE